MMSGSGYWSGSSFDQSRGVGTDEIGGGGPCAATAGARARPPSVARNERTVRSLRSSSAPIRCGHEGYVYRESARSCRLAPMIAQNSPICCTASARGLAIVACVVLFVVPMAARLAFQARPAAVRSQLVWFDRAGKRAGVLGTLADYGNVELSPDGQRLAVAVLDQTRGTHDIWMYDIATGRPTTFTSNPADENWLIWSPDGKRVVFNSQRSGGLDLYQSSSSAGSPEEVLLLDRDAKWPVSWSPDGRFILYVISGRATGNDILCLSSAIASRTRFCRLPPQRIGRRSRPTAVGSRTARTNRGNRKSTSRRFQPGPDASGRFRAGEALRRAGGATAGNCSI